MQLGLYEVIVQGESHMYAINVIATSAKRALDGGIRYARRLYAQAYEGEMEVREFTPATFSVKFDRKIDAVN